MMIDQTNSRYSMALLFVDLSGRLMALLIAMLLTFLFSNPSYSADTETFGCTDAQVVCPRILSLPDARLLATLGGQVVREQVPVFTVYYVHEKKLQDGEPWLRVSERPQWSDEEARDLSRVADSQGWVAMQYTERWRNMVVLQFAAQGRAQRKRVLFYRDGERRELKDLLGQTSRQRKQTLKDILRDIEDCKADEIASREPPVVPDQQSRMAGGDAFRYLIPVIDWDKNARFRNGTNTTLVKAAIINSASPNALQPDSKAACDANNAYVGRRRQGTKDMKIGVVFVVDTTSSMAPYLQRTKDLIRQVYKEFDASEQFRDKVSYGMVGYQDYRPPDDTQSSRGTGENEYITRDLHALDANTDVEVLLNKLKRIRVSEVSTQGWNEDAWAGLERALNADWWGPFDVRLVYLITDAGARSADDPHASSTATPGSLAELAQSKDIVVYPMHLHTRAAAQQANVRLAMGQYRNLSGIERYTGIEGADDPERFSANLQASTAKLSEALEQWADDRRLSEEDVGDDILKNDLFDAQMRFIGRVREQQVQRSYFAWAADHDLWNPAVKSFDIKLLMTRTELSGLAQGVKRLLNLMAENELSPEDLFDQLQGMAATYSVDSRRQSAAGAPVTLGDELGRWLAELPYESDILALSEREWIDMGAEQRTRYIDDLQEKLNIYRQIRDNTSRWYPQDDSSDNSDVEKLTLIDLRHLP